MMTKRALSSLFAMVAAVGIAVGTERPASASVYGPGYVCSVAYTPLFQGSSSGMNGAYATYVPTYPQSGGLTNTYAYVAGSDAELYIEVWSGPNCTGSQLVFGYFYTIGANGGGSLGANNWTEQGLIALWHGIQSAQQAGRRVQINGSPSAYNGWTLDIAVFY
jgi:hypothetical protein